jgi:methylmalonyl-CoA mutase C-terminal domain/subunit
MNRKIRMLIAKPGLDGHDRGAKFVARALKEEGVEVIYTGLHQTPEMIVNAAVQEDVDAIGLSILSGGQVSLINRIVQLLKGKKADNILLIVGGIVPKSDREILTAMGVSKFFGPGTSSNEIVQFIKDFF